MVTAHPSFLSILSECNYGSGISNGFNRNLVVGEDDASLTDCKNKALSSQEGRNTESRDTRQANAHVHKNTHTHTHKTGNGTSNHQHGQGCHCK